MELGPTVRYATTVDGFRIAYVTSGSGASVVSLPAAHSHVQFNLQQRFFVPSRPVMLRAIEARYRLIQFDHRGHGMSQRDLPDTYSSEDRLLDLEAVADALQLQDMVLFGAHEAVRFAAKHPHRVKALVLLACPISMSAWPSGMFQLLPSQNWDAFLRTQLTNGLSAADVEAGMDMLRQMNSQHDWELTWQAFERSNLSELLPLVSTPTLVIHARDFDLLAPEESMKLAGRIPDAQMVLVDGAGMYGEVAQTINAIDRFLATLPGQNASPESPFAALSMRELEVLRLVSAGRSNPQIAQELFISVNTVQRHVSNVFAKTGSANQTEATAYAIHNGLG